MDAAGETADGRGRPPRESDVGSGASRGSAPQSRSGRGEGRWPGRGGCGGGRGGGGRGGAGGVFQEFFFGPCGHAATSSSSALVGGAPDLVHRQRLDIPVMLQRRVPTVQMTVEILQVLLLDRFLTCPLLCNATCAVLGCQGRRQHCRGAEAVSLGPDCSENHCDSLVAVGRSSRFHGCYL